ncbi:uridine diphosphate glucose pyrophosphatase NUDT22 [Aulostomus maculatus]
MDPEVSLLLHCGAWRGLSQSQVQVELSESYNRQTDTALERHIEEVWTERVSKEPWLFNGAKFRLHSFHLASPTRPSAPAGSSKLPPCTPSSCCVEDQDSRSHWEHTGEEIRLQDAALNSFDLTKRCENPTKDSILGHTPSTCTAEHSSQPDEEEARLILTLRVGLTCYKDYLGTNWSCRVSELRQRGEVEFSNSVALLAQPLGVGAIMCTKDGQMVLIRRSQKVAEAGGLLDIPGGHPEPKVVCERLGQVVQEEQISVALLQQRSDAVISELFSSVCAEIRDEVNVPLSFLGEPILMGVALNHTSAGRPSAEFYVSCSLTSDEVRKLYWKGGPEAHESTDIIFISRTEMMQLDMSSPLWSELCPSAKGGVLLFQTVKLD